MSIYKKRHEKYTYAGTNMDVMTQEVNIREEDMEELGYEYTTLAQTSHLFTDWSKRKEQAELAALHQEARVRMSKLRPVITQVVCVDSDDAPLIA